MTDNELIEEWLKHNQVTKVPMGASAPYETWTWKTQNKARAINAAALQAKTEYEAKMADALRAIAPDAGDK